MAAGLREQHAQPPRASASAVPVPGLEPRWHGAVTAWSRRGHGCGHDSEPHGGITGGHAPRLSFQVGWTTVITEFRFRAHVPARPSWG